MSLFSPATWIVLLSALAVAAATPTDPRAAARVESSRAIPAGSAPAVAGGTDLSEYVQPTAIPFPADAPYTPAMARLGRTLFFDARLSASGTMSCASCHNPALSWTSGTARVSGVGGTSRPRHTPTIANLAWRDSFMADGRVGDLMEQVFVVLENPQAMGRPRGELPGLFDGIPSYRALLAAAAPGEHFTPELVARAIATFERSIVYAPAAFDTWVAGDAHAISEAAQRGFAVFTGTGGCSSCHSGWNFEDGGFHDIGLPDDDPGRGRLMPRVVKMQHAFRTPGLRDIARRGPYMHDGSLPSLQAVVEHYDQGGVDRDSRSELVHPLGLSAQDKADLVAFLESLTAGWNDASMQLVTP